MNVLRWLRALRFTCALAAFAVFPCVGPGQTAAERPWGDEVEARLELAGENRSAIAQALREAPAARRPGMIFLVENMPLADLRSLTADFLLENLNLAYDGWEKSPWHDSVAEEMFFNDVLPYACTSEKRDRWRAKLREVCLPMIASCKAPGEAAHLLNQKVFPHFNVRYNTGRRRPDQSPGESIGSGKATCTGLSILLVDACRSVGIPARIAGTPMWSNMRGNHTWVEVWDNSWHFIGAAEPDAAGLDHGWFVEDASKAQRDVPQHAIYATSFRRTGVSFPLVWLPGDKSVGTVNVTDRYAKAKAPVENVVRLAAKVVEADGKRAAADIVLTDLGNSANSWTDKSRGETADLNDLASFKLVPGARYRVVAQLNGRVAQAEVTAQESGDEQVTLTLPEKPPVAAEPSEAVPQPVKPLPPNDSVRLKEELDKYFAANAVRQAKWKFPSRLGKLLRENEPAVRQVAWESYRRAPIHTSLKADFDTNVVRFEQYISPYTVKQVGTRPAKGWPLFIAMHGGGGAPKQVNDSQWKQMQRYYRDHPEAGGYLYLALRAPNDTWNGFYDNYVYPLIDNLIRL
jgi:hypothetical protein